MTDLSMTELNNLLAEFEAARVELTADDLTALQRKALDKTIAKTVHSWEEIKKLEIHSSSRAGYVYVYCVGGLAGDEGTAAEFFARSRFHACIGPRGGVKYL
jgi:hypothetical protein